MSKAFRIIAGGMLAILLALGAARLLAQPIDSPAYLSASEGGVQVIAHQGGNHLWPDNTLYAFERTEELGVDMLEMDLHMTADGEIVVIHDDTVDRTTDGSGAVRDLALAEIKALDAGYYWQSPSEDIRASYAEDYPYRGAGITVPAFIEVLERFPGIPLTVEIKQDDPPIGQAVCDLLTDYDRLDDVLVASFSSAAMRDFRAVCPDALTSASQDEMIGFYVLYRLFLGPVYSPSFEAVQVPVDRFNLTLVSPRFVDAVHRRGAAVQVWTINDRDEMERLVEMGVDGLITDRPDLLLEVLGR